MASEKDLINAVRESLRNDGELNRMRAEMRTEVIKLLDNCGKTKHPKYSNDILMLNELIREYFEWIGYRYSAMVFSTESDLPKHPLDKSLLTQYLGVEESESSSNVPLLCGLIETFKKMKSP